MHECMRAVVVWWVQTYSSQLNGTIDADLAGRTAWVWMWVLMWVWVKMHVAYDKDNVLKT